MTLCQRIGRGSRQPRNNKIEENMENYCCTASKHKISPPLLFSVFIVVIPLHGHINSWIQIGVTVVSSVAQSTSVN